MSLAVASTISSIRKGLTDVDWSRHAPAAHGMDRLGRKTVGSATT